MNNLLLVSNQGNLLISACHFDPVFCPKPAENKTMQVESIAGVISCINFTY